MKLRIFNKLMQAHGLKQEASEWQMFLEFCSMYLKNHKIKNPIVVELGMGLGKQREFWKQLFEAKYIAVDMADIEAWKKFKRKIKNRFIDILFIDGSRFYEVVRKDFELYSPLCDGIIALHNIDTFRDTARKSAQVWKFWDELKSRKCEAAQEYKDSLFLSIFHRCKRGCQRGIGVIITK